MENAKFILFEIETYSIKKELKTIHLSFQDYKN